MTQRIALETLGNASKTDGSSTPCAFAVGETADAPECSAGLVLSTCLEQLHRESIRGICDTGRYPMPYRVWGNGPALIFIPGLCDDATSFVLPMSRLRRDYCCIAYDLPAGKGDADHFALVDDLIALANHLRLESATLFGSSFGGTIALAALVREPKRFPIGIVQGGFARRPLAWTEVLFARLARRWSGRLGQLPFWRGMIERMYAAEFANLEPARWPFLMKQRGDVPIAAVAHRALLLHELDLRPLLPTIRQPVMSICGERDSLVIRAQAEELRTGLPNFAHAEIEGCGHLPHLTHPEVLCEAIEQFLAGCRESVESGG